MAGAYVMKSKTAIAAMALLAIVLCSVSAGIYYWHGTDKKPITETKTPTQEIATFEKVETLINSGKLAEARDLLELESARNQMTTEQQNDMHVLVRAGKAEHEAAGKAEHERAGTAEHEAATLAARACRDGLSVKQREQLDRVHLLMAKERQRENWQSEAIRLLQKIPPGSAHYEEAQNLIREGNYQ